MNKFTRSSLVNTLVTDGLLLLALQSPYPKALTTIGLITSVVARGPTDGAISGADALAAAGILRLLSGNLTRTHFLFAGSGLLWGAGRLVWSWPAIAGEIIHTEPESREPVSVESEQADGTVVKFALLLENLKALKELPAASCPKPSLSALLTRDLSTIVDGVVGRQFLADLRHCCAQDSFDLKQIAGVKAVGDFCIAGQRDLKNALVRGLLNSKQKQTTIFELLSQEAATNKAGFLHDIKGFKLGEKPAGADKFATDRDLLTFDLGAEGVTDELRQCYKWALVNRLNDRKPLCIGTAEHMQCKDKITVQCLLNSPYALVWVITESRGRFWAHADLLHKPANSPEQLSSPMEILKDDSSLSSRLQLGIPLNLEPQLEEEWRALLQAKELPFLPKKAKTTDLTNLIRRDLSQLAPGEVLQFLADLRLKMSNAKGMVSIRQAKASVDVTGSIYSKPELLEALLSAPWVKCKVECQTQLLPEDARIRISKQPGARVTFKNPKK